MPAQQTDWTAEMARALPDDGKRYEVLDGALLVSPAPGMDHQRVVVELVARLREYLRSNGVGEVYVAPTEVVFSSRRSFQPDVFVIPPARAPRPKRYAARDGLLLVSEVLSPGTARSDRVFKRGVYMDEGVPEYWILDPDARVVERWVPSTRHPEVLSERLEWQPVAGVEPFRLDLAEFFAAALG